MVTVDASHFVRLSALAIYTIACVAFPALAQQATVEASAVVGEWCGSWKSKDGGKGGYCLVISRVDSGQVSGQLTVTAAVGSAPYPPESIEGALEGNMLKYQARPSGRSGNLIVRSLRMVGSGQGTRGELEIELAKTRR
jgi:hypothetical protein